jgi:hypothetical protein
MKTYQLPKKIKKIKILLIITEFKYNIFKTKSFIVLFVIYFRFFFFFIMLINEKKTMVI